MEEKYIFLILNSNQSSRNKIFSIFAIIESLLQEKYILLEEERTKQYILSEILYIYEKNETSEITPAWLKQRLKFLINTLTEHNFIALRTEYEFGIDYLENLENLSDQPFKKKSPTKFKKIQGWQKKTQRRFEKYCCFNSFSEKKEKNSKKIIQLFLPVTQKKYKKMENFLSAC